MRFADALVSADLQGNATHGVSRLAIYVKRMQRGLIEPRAALTVKHRHGGVLALDANNGLGQVQALKAEKLVLVGLSTDMCVHFTAMDAYMHGYSVWVPADCTAAKSEAAKALALRQMSSVLQCSVRRASATRLLPTRR